MVGKRLGNTQDLEFLKVADICNACYEFTINSIFIKENVVSDFGISDVGYIEIGISGDAYMISVRQKALLDGFRTLLKMRDSGEEANLGKHYMIQKPEGKAYYCLYEAE